MYFQACESPHLVAWGHFWPRAFFFSRTLSIFFFSRTLSIRDKTVLPLINLVGHGKGKIVSGMSIDFTAPYEAKGIHLFFCWFFKSLFVPFFPPQELPGYYYLLSVYAPTLWKKCSCWRKSVLRAETGHLFSLANSLQDFWCLKLKYPVPIKFNVKPNVKPHYNMIFFLFFIINLNPKKKKKIRRHCIKIKLLRSALIKKRGMCHVRGRAAGYIHNIN